MITYGAWLLGDDVEGVHWIEILLGLVVVGRETVYGTIRKSAMARHLKLKKTIVMIHVYFKKYTSVKIMYRYTHTYHIYI